MVYYKKHKNENGDGRDGADDGLGNNKKKKSKKEERVIDRIEVKLILHTIHKTAFRGFIIDIISLKSMFQLYIEKKNIFNSIATIATYKLLQDVLEMLFSRIRSCGGFNNNPNIQQLKGAFR